MSSKTNGADVFYFIITPLMTVDDVPVVFGGKNTDTVCSKYEPTTPPQINTDIAGRHIVKACAFLHGMTTSDVTTIECVVHQTMVPTIFVKSEIDGTRHVTFSTDGADTMVRHLLLQCEGM